MPTARTLWAPAAGPVLQRRLRLPHRGLPIPKGGQGDLYAVVQVSVPGVVSDRERSLYQELEQASAYDPRAHLSQGGSHAS